MDVDTYMKAHLKNGYHDEGPNGFGCIECGLWRQLQEARKVTDLLDDGHCPDCGWPNRGPHLD